jgi:hypothetical protein
MRLSMLYSSVCHEDQRQLGCIFEVGICGATPPLKSGTLDLPQIKPAEAQAR